MTIQNRAPHLITDRWGRFQSVALWSPVTPTVGAGDDGFLWADIGVDGTVSYPVLKVYDEPMATWQKVALAPDVDTTLAANSDVRGVSQKAVKTYVDITTGGITGLANPSASVGLTAVNGVATTAIRSDGAPALSQAIAPTWIGKHIWQPSVDATDVLKVLTNAGAVVIQADTVNRRLGIGIAPSTALHANIGTVTDASNTCGTFVSANAITSDLTVYAKGAYFMAYEQVAATKTNSGYLYGLHQLVFRNYFINADSGTLAMLVANFSQYGHYFTDGTAVPVTTLCIGLQLMPYVHTGTITTLYGVLVDDGTSGGSVGTYYGLRIDDLLATVSTAYWGVYQDAKTGGKNFLGNNLLIGLTIATAAQLDVWATTGGIVSLNRGDTAVVANDLIGTLQWWTNDTELTTRNIAALIDVYATATIATDAPQAYMVFSVAGSAAATAPIEHMRFAPTTVARIGFFGTAPVVKPTSLTTQLTTITPPAYTGDFAIQAVTQTTPFGFVNANEGNTLINCVANLQTRIAEIESKFQGLGLLT
jgi:hypothetical protein